MKYQIVYLNHYGNAQILAAEMQRYLPAGYAETTDLSAYGIPNEADIYLLCFEITRGTVPIEILEALEYLNEKTILLFVTCSATLSNNPQKIEKNILPFLPDNCDYRGIFACPGQQPEEVFHQMQSVLVSHPTSQKANTVLQNYQQCLGHPNQADFASAYTFLKRSLDACTHGGTY